MTGATYYLISAFLCICFFCQDACHRLHFFYDIGGSISGIGGQNVGQDKTLGQESLEGSAACFVVCASIALVTLNPIIALIGALVATVVELIPFPIDDNLTVPLISGVVMHFLMQIFLAL